MRRGFELVASLMQIKAHRHARDTVQHKAPRLERAARGIALMVIHKKILEWQAVHPNITWIGWGIVWAIVLAILFWPRRSG
jgi:hypothetical protein